MIETDMYFYKINDKNNKISYLCWNSRNNAKKNKKFQSHPHGIHFLHKQTKF